MTFTQSELLAYTQSIVDDTVMVFSGALAALIVLNYSISFGLWWYQKKVDNK